MRAADIKNKSSPEYQAIACLQGSLSTQNPVLLVRGRSLSAKYQISAQWVQVFFALQRDKKIEREFNELREKWELQRPRASSFVSNMVTHPAYQEIIGMGPRALPHILRELDKKPNQWFWALKAISREDPVSASDRGNIQKMRDAWLRWGREKGHIR